MQEINSVAFLRLLRPSTRGVGVYVGIAFAKLFGMRGSATIFGNFTNIASAKNTFWPSPSSFAGGPSAKP